MIVLTACWIGMHLASPPMVPGPPAAPVAPVATVELGSIATQGFARRVAIYRGHAFVATDYYGLEAFDVTDPANPVAAGTYVSPGGAYDLAIGAPYCYLADNDQGVQVVDVSNPSSLVFVNNLPAGLFGGQAFGACVARDLLFVFCGNAGMRVLDLAVSATNPPVIGVFYTLGSQYHNDGVVVGDLVYVADGVHGPDVIDVSDPTNPTQVATSGNLDSFDLAVIGDTIYSAAAFGGLRVHDASTPYGNPLPIIGSYPTSLFFNLDIDAAARGGQRYAFLANTNLGCLIFDVTNGTNPVLLDTVAADTGAVGVTARRTLFFVAAGSAGLRIFSSN